MRTAHCTCTRPAVSPRHDGPGHCVICQRPIAPERTPTQDVSESIEAKARRYLADGRLHIVRVDGATVRAICAGSAQYPLGRDPGRGSWCRCPARGMCAHLRALQLVTSPERKQAERGGR